MRDRRLVQYVYAFAGVKQTVGVTVDRRVCTQLMRNLTSGIDIKGREVGEGGGRPTRSQNKTEQDLPGDEGMVCNGCHGDRNDSGVFSHTTKTTLLLHTTFHLQQKISCKRWEKDINPSCVCPCKTVQNNIGMLLTTLEILFFKT